MTLQDLVDQAQAGHIDDLHLISIEGGSYVLHAWQGERAHPIKDERGNPLHLRSLEHARDVLRELPELPFHLVHGSAYDEMCGLPGGSREPLKVPVSLRSSC